MVFPLILLLLGLGAAVHSVVARQWLEFVIAIPVVAAGFSILKERQNPFFVAAAALGVGTKHAGERR